MKTILTAIVLLVLATAVPLHAQIPNPGFENWTGINPDGWVVFSNIPTVDTTVMKTTAGHTGSALLGKVGIFSYFGYVTLFPPIIYSEFPVSQRYSTFTGWYTFNPVGGDSISIWAEMLKSNTPIGFAYATLSPRNSFGQFQTNFQYIASGTPDSCLIEMLITGSAASHDSIHIGSTMVIDDLAFSGVDGVEAAGSSLPSTYALRQNYPNPFNPSTVISYDLPAASHVLLRVYNMLGEEVATLINAGENPGRHVVRFDASGLPSGAYFYRLSTGTFTETKRLMLLR